MRRVFADTAYWIALASPRDGLHEVAQRKSRELGPCQLVTTDEVLVEFFAHFRDKGSEGRRIAVRFAEKLMQNPNVEVIPQTRETLRAGIRYFAARADKEYSLTDCISMDTMEREKINEALTSDRHFTQEGFRVLLTLDP